MTSTHLALDSNTRPVSTRFTFASHGHDITSFVWSVPPCKASASSQQARLVSVKAERPNYPSHCHQAGGVALWGGVSQPGGGQPAKGGGGAGPPRRHVHDYIRPIRLTVALGLKSVHTIDVCDFGRGLSLLGL